MLKLMCIKTYVKIDGYYPSILTYVLGAWDGSFEHPQHMFWLRNSTLWYHVLLEEHLNVDVSLWYNEYDCAYSTLIITKTVALYELKGVGHIPGRTERRTSNYMQKTAPSSY